MKAELFKELNAHIRACDNKSMALSGAYVASILYLYSNRAGGFFLRGLDGLPNISDFSTNLTFLLSVIFVGCVVLFVQIWYRGWKVHYMFLLNEMYQNSREELVLAPAWMRSKPRMFSYDLIFRILPIYVNAVVLSQLSFLYDTHFGPTFFTVLAMTEVANLAISVSIILFVRRVAYHKA